MTDCVICYMHFMTAQQIVYGRIDQHHIVPIILELYGSFTISNYFLNVVFVTDCTRVKTTHMKAIPCYILVVLCLQVFFLCYSLIPLFHMHRIHMVVAKPGSERQNSLRGVCHRWKHCWWYFGQSPKTDEKSASQNKLQK